MDNFSKTLQGVEERKNWKNVRLVNEVNPEEINRWKQQPGKDLNVGGNNLAVSLACSGLIDEFRIMVNPVALGKGTLLLHGMNEKLNLKLLSTRTFKSGNVLLCYEPLNRSF